MKNVEKGVVPFSQPFDAKSEHPIDRIRPDFMHHIMSPLTHTAIVRNIDMFRSAFLSQVQGDDRGIIQDYFDKPERTVPGYQPESPISLSVRLLGNTLSNMDMMMDLPFYPAWSRFTTPQLIAADRFISFGDSDNTKSSDHMLIESGVDTFTEVLHQIESRRRDLGLSDPAQMVSFLREPLTPHLLRGLATGGFGFIADLRGNSRNSHSAIRPWRGDPNKPILDTLGTYPRASSELRHAANIHRKYIADLPAEGLTRNGVFGPGLQYSKGCPVRFETFQTGIETLTAFGLQLSREQLMDMMSGDNPIISYIGTNDESAKDEYRVERDAYAAVGNVIADALELTTL